MIKEIKIKIDGYVMCKSSFYTVYDIIANREFCFTSGVNRLLGEIDSGIFGISYLISMLDEVNKETIFTPLVAEVDGTVMPLSQLTEYACYLDDSYPLFSTGKTIRSLVNEGLSISGLEHSPEQICEMFGISDSRFDRPIKQSGNERFKAMAAIGYCFGKEIFCLPWLSKMRYEGFTNHMTYLTSLLDSLGKLVIVPTGI